MVVYSGSSPQRISALFDAHHAGGYTEFRNVHGAGTAGKREGSRAWPGESTLFVTVVPDARSDELVAALRAEVPRLPVSEGLHVAILPTIDFF